MTKLFKPRTPHPLLAFSFCSSILETTSKPAKTSNRILHELYNEERITEKHNCEGCGVKIQSEKEDSPGYLSKTQFIDILAKKDERAKNLQSLKNEIKFKESLQRKSNQKEEKGSKSHPKILKEFNNVDDYAKFNKSVELGQTISHEQIKKFEKALKPVYLICVRCFQLKNKNQIIHGEIDEKKGEEIKEMILEKIPQASTIMYLIDSTDMKGTICMDVLQKIKEKAWKTYFILNKSDVLPKTIKSPLHYQNFHFYIDQIFNKNEDNFETFMVSKSLKDLSAEKSLSKVNRNIYVVGNTNSGKSTFLNALIKLSESKSFSSELIDKLQTKLLQQEQTTDLITTSSFPNTTQDFITLHMKKLNINIIDTPGFHSISQPIFQDDNSKKKDLLMTKELKPQVFTFKHKTALFLGGLIRIENPSDQSIIAHIYVSPKISIHMVELKSANESYIRNYGKKLTPVIGPIEDVRFKKSEYDISYGNNGISSHELEFGGIGWISFERQEKTLYSTKFEIFTESSIEMSIRERIYDPKKKPTIQKPKSKGNFRPKPNSSRKSSPKSNEKS